MVIGAGLWRETQYISGVVIAPRRIKQCIRLEMLGGVFVLMMRAEEIREVVGTECIVTPVAPGSVEWIVWESISWARRWREFETIVRWMRSGLGAIFGRLEEDGIGRCAGSVSECRFDFGVLNDGWR